MASWNDVACVAAGAALCSAMSIASVGSALHYWSSAVADARRNRHRAREEARIASQVQKDGMGSFYDLVVDIPRFMDLFANEDTKDEENRTEFESNDGEQRKQGGWPLLVSDTSLGPWQGPIVAVLGEYDKGKTFLLNHLAECGLPSGLQTRTLGLSLKQVMGRGRAFVLLDSAGSRTPLESLTEESRQQKKAQEEFLRHVAFDMADVFIYVVNELNITEQEEIRLLSIAVEKSSQKRFKKVVVVHNLREICTQEQMDLQVARICKVYWGCQMQKQVMGTDGDKNSLVQYLDGAETEGQEGLENQMHFWLGKDGSPAGVNNRWVLEKIRNAVLEFQVKKATFSIQERLETSLTSKMTNFVDPAPNVVLDPENGRVCLKEHLKEKSSGVPKAPVQYHLRRQGGVENYLNLNSIMPEPYDMYETDTEVVLVFEMCGVKAPPEVFRVRSSTGWQLSVEAERECPAAPRAFLSRERWYGKLRREVTVPYQKVTEADPVQSWANGILTLRFEKPKEDRKVLTNSIFEVE
eukprot:RCo028110